MTLTRCHWANQYDIFIPYHDKEWGVPLYEDQPLFAMLMLESLQAGLSWRLILQRRAALEHHFDHFQPEKIARYDDQRYQALLNNPEIIRNRAKIKAIIHNAQCYLNLPQQGISFSDELWRIVDGKPIVNQWQQQQQVPSKTFLSDNMTTLLKSWGFKFVGSTTCYSFMQAVGMINDHLTSCFRYQEICQPHH